MLIVRWNINWQLAKPNRHFEAVQSPMCLDNSERPKDM